MSRRNGRVVTVAASIVTTLLLASGCSQPSADLAVPGINAQNSEDQARASSRFPVAAVAVPDEGLTTPPAPEATEAPTPSGTTGGMGRPRPFPQQGPSGAAAPAQPSGVAPATGAVPTGPVAGPGPTSTPAPATVGGATARSTAPPRAERPRLTSSTPVHIPTTLVKPTPPEPLSRKVEETIPMPQPEAVVAAGGSVWVRQGEGTLTRVDPATNAVIATVPATGGASCHGLGGVGNVLWTCAGDGAVTRIDPVTNTVAARININKVPEQRLIPMAFDHAWFLVDGGTSLVGVSHAESNVAISIPLEASCVAVDATDASLWVACPGTGEVLRVNPYERTVVARIGGLPGARVVAGGASVWVGFDRGTARINRTTGEVDGAVDTGPSEQRGSLYAAGNLVYIRTQDQFLQVIDATTLEMVEQVSVSEAAEGSTVLAFGSLWATSGDGVLYRLRPPEATAESSSSSPTTSPAP